MSDPTLHSDVVYRVCLIAAIVGMSLVSCVAPGLLAVRKLRWAPTERLMAAAGLSCFFMYLAAGLSYLLKLPIAFAWGIAIVSLLAGVMAWSEFGRLWRDRHARQALVATMALATWCVLLLGCVRCYNGGRWAWDWWEHYLRAVFFLDHEPLDTTFGPYGLTARPPLQNLLTAHVLAQTGKSLLVYQAFSAILAAMPALAALHWVRIFNPRRLEAGALLAALLALCPMFVQNATFTWTKSLASFFVLAALALYWRGWMKSDTSRLVAAFGSLAMGILVHYSVAVFAVVLAGHYLCAVFHRDRRAHWAELVGSVTFGALILGTWFAPAIAAYGVLGTLASNSSVTAARGFTLEQNAAKMFWNIAHTIVPFLFRTGTVLPPDLDRVSSVREAAFFVYQTTLLGGLGSVGAVVVPVVLCRRLGLHGHITGPQRRFWLTVIFGATVLGVAVVGTPEPFGVAHICLLPLVFLGVSFLAAEADQLAPITRWLLSLGLAVDLALGILLHHALQSRQAIPYVDEGGNLGFDLLGLGWGVVPCTATKLQNGLRFPADALGSVLPYWLAATSLIGAGVWCFAFVLLTQKRNLAAPKRGS